MEGSKKYHPIVRHQSRPEEDQDISDLYHKAMEDGRVPSSRKKEAYLKAEESGEQESKDTV